jgi:hypothetical protein
MDSSTQQNLTQQNLNEVTEKVKEYAELQKTIKITQEKLKVLNKKKKELYKEVVPRLKTTNITKCNLPFGTLKVVKTKRKIMPSKVTMKDKYISFFNSAFDEHFVGLSSEEKAEMMYRYIYIDNIEYKEESNITMSYSKDFKDSFKQLSI